MAILYYIIFAIIYLISLLPFRALYLFSDFLNLVLFRMLGYREEIVLTNLRRSFPEKSSAEIQRIRKSFNRYFCDLIVESVKTLSISPASLSKRVHFQNKSLFEKYYEANQSLILVLGHLGNWELMGAAFAPLPYHKLFVIYHPLRNQIFDRLLYYMRTRLGNDLYPMKETFQGMVANRDQVTATAFIADQTPSPVNAYWTTFLHQDTPVYTGTERIAQKLGYPVIYMSTRMPKRGTYLIEAKVITDHPNETKPGEISEQHTRMLEQDILEQPEIWLWTHRRWKHHKRQTN